MFSYANAAHLSAENAPSYIPFGFTLLSHSPSGEHLSARAPHKETTMRLKTLFADRSFWRSALRLALPIALQNLLL